MSHTTTPTQALMTAADELSFKLYNLAELTKLAAFASEARRTLTAISDLAKILPEVGDNIKQCVPSPRAWSERHDNTGEVLFYIADELQSVRDALDTTLSALKRETVGSEAEPLEGAGHAL